MNIHTQLHDLISVAGEEPLVERMTSAPKYCISPEIVEIMTRGDVQRSIQALIEAQIAHLPYEEVLIEFSIVPEMRRFCLLEEAAGGFRMASALLQRRQNVVIYGTTPTIWLTDAGLRVEGHNDPAEAAEAVLAVSIALLMLNTRGIDKEHIEPIKLNRQRLKSGKAAIPGHTLVHIGSIYDRDGNRTGATGRHMPVHLRAGHTRWQAHGERMSERKLVFIQPVLVNYHPGDEVKAPNRVVVA